MKKKLTAMLAALMMLGGLAAAMAPQASALGSAVQNASVVASKSRVGTSTIYVWTTWPFYRNKITTHLGGIGGSTGPASIVLRAANSTGTTQAYGYSYASTKSGSVTLGVGVGVKAIEVEASGTVTYSSTTTISATVSVPAHKTYTVYLRYDCTDKYFYSVVQPQWLPWTTWVNRGTARNATSVWHQRFPYVWIQ